MEKCFPVFENQWLTVFLFLCSARLWGHECDRCCDQLCTDRDVSASQGLFPWVRDTAHSVDSGYWGNLHLHTVYTQRHSYVHVHMVVVTHFFDLQKLYVVSIVLKETWILKNVSLSFSDFIVTSLWCHLSCDIIWYDVDHFLINNVLLLATLVHRVTRLHLS